MYFPYKFGYTTATAWVPLRLPHRKTSDHSILCSLPRCYNLLRTGAWVAPVPQVSQGVYLLCLDSFVSLSPPHLITSFMDLEGNVENNVEDTPDIGGTLDKVAVYLQLLCPGGIYR
jgi:hypothetical protein